MVARIAGRKVSDRDLHFRSMITQIISVIFSNAIMLCVVTVWVFVIPCFAHAGAAVGIPQHHGTTTRPVHAGQRIFSRSGSRWTNAAGKKLLNYTQGTNNNTPTKQNLRSNLVEKKRVKFGMKYWPSS